MTNLEQLSIVDGPAPYILYTLAAAAFLWLVLGPRRYMLRWVPAVAVVSALAGVLFWYLAEDVWNLWGEPLPLRIYVFAAIAVAAVALLVPKMISLRRAWTRIAAVPVAAVVVLACSGLVNQAFEYYPTVGSLFGNTGVKIKSLAEFRAEQQATGAGHGAPPPAATAVTWVPPLNMPAHGDVLNVNIPGTISHEVSSSAYVYLPPAYLATPRAANLPVLVLIHGVPGGTIDWLRGGQINQFMDGYAAAHHGLAPIVVMPDAGARWSANPPACMDSKEGKAGTYLARDVPDWIKATFDVGTRSPRQWAVGGFSYGGTCAMTLAMNHPEAYPTFIDSSGEDRPTVAAGHAAMLSRYFNNDARAFSKQNALDVMKTRKYPGTAGIITVGSSDRYYRPQGVKVYDAMRRDGIHVTLQDAPGGHAWPAWRYGVYNNMDWLMQRLGVG
ncbi:alpha/beta hydrolase [Specibacter cremeus]|uniref:alpha/beta hydrolase n=1 Tax=Specibacter cremeus TaxID=1629051 RepID=UPI000F78EC13|nr:alpha/beta hydrolase-fold protein [Specibacter cremeus]